MLGRLQFRCRPTWQLCCWHCCDCVSLPSVVINLQVTFKGCRSIATYYKPLFYVPVRTQTYHAIKQLGQLEDRNVSFERRLYCKEAHVIKLPTNLWMIFRNENLAVLISNVQYRQFELIGKFISSGRMFLSVITHGPHLGDERLCLNRSSRFDLSLIMHCPVKGLHKRWIINQSINQSYGVYRSLLIIPSIPLSDQNWGILISTESVMLIECIDDVYHVLPLAYVSRHRRTKTTWQFSKTWVC